MRPYRVTLYEVPVPPESQRLPSVTVEAAGPIDAIVKAGPLLNGHTSPDRRAARTFWLRPFAFLRAQRAELDELPPALDANVRDFRGCR